MLVALNKSSYLIKVSNHQYIDSSFFNRKEVFKVIKIIDRSNIPIHDDMKYQTCYLLKDKDIYKYSFTSNIEFLQLFEVVSK